MTPDETPARRRRRWPWIAALLVLGLVLTASQVGSYRVIGCSDAPTYLVGDLIFVQRAAYDLRLPWTDVVLLSHSDPERGDVVAFRRPGSSDVIFKRVVGVPGDRLVMTDNRLVVNGRALTYEVQDRASHDEAPAENRLGAVVAIESGNGEPHLVTHGEGGGPHATFGPVDVPDGGYFLVGDNRDESLDSRAYGAVPREAIVGRVGRPCR